MATQPTCFSDLVSYGEGGHFPSFLYYSNNVEDDKVLLGLLSDADFAEELQFHEALKASLIVSEMSSNVSSSSSSSSSLVTMGELPFPAHNNDQPSPEVKEKGGSSLSFCEICLERMEGDHLVKNHGSIQAFCFNCSKTIELSKEEYCSEGLSIQSNSGNYSTQSSTITATNNPNVHVNTEKRTDIISLNPADIDGESAAYARKDECGAEKLEGAHTPDHEAPRCKDEYQNSVTRSDNPVTLVDGGNEDQNSTTAGSKNMASKSESLSPTAVGRICNMQPSIHSTSDDGQQQALAHDIVNIVDAADANGNSDFEMSPKRRILKKFFMEFEKLTTEKINEPSRRWHCPACVGGSPGIKSFQGLQAFISHAKTRAACKRGGSHRELMQLMEEKLLVKDTSAVPACEMSGKWKGLKQKDKDHEIVWPPMVVIRNTCLQKDANHKWVCMTNQELLDLFSAYGCIAKAQHAHDSQGHPGMSVLIFEGSARGYFEAERLHNHLANQGTDRNAWNHSPVYVLPGGERQLYGYLAVKEDVDLVNQSKTGSNKLKCEMRSYREMVVNGIRKMYEDNQQLLWLKNGVAQKQMHPKDAEESFEAIRARLSHAMKEIQVLRDRINLQDEQHLEEMNCQEQFFKDKMMSTLEERSEKEEDSVSTQNEGEDGPESPQLSRRMPLNTQDNKEETAESKKNKGKEKENFVAATDDEPGGSSSSWYGMILE